MQSIDTLNSEETFIKLECHELLIGMFVSEIDCSWSATPFPLGGFHIRTPEQIQMLAKFCKCVHIDTTKGALPKRKKRDHLTILSTARKASPPAAAFKVNRELYPVSSSIKKQIDGADKYYQELLSSYVQLTQHVRVGETIDLASLDKPAKGLIDSLLANPQTLIWLLNTDSFPIHPTAYSVRAAIWACILARQIGLPRGEIEPLFMGTLLSDIGMYLLPERLVQKRGKFRKKEFLAYKKHVNFSLDLLSQFPDLDEKIIRVVRCHHERNDGLGFPRGLSGEQIPALARLANLGYCFERILRSLSDTQSISPAKAISSLYKQRDLKFPEQLVVEFIHLMGMYPSGTLVELNTGEIAVVLEQHPQERLSPKVAILTDESQVKIIKPKVIQLGEDKEGRSVLSSLGPKHKGVRACDYRFNFFGKRLGFGSIGIRF